MICQVADRECLMGCRCAYRNLPYGPLKLKTAIAADEIWAAAVINQKCGREIGFANLLEK